MAQINKIANIFWEADPIAQMQYEYDRAVDELKEGRVGLEQYRGLVERVHAAGRRQPVARAEARGRDQGVSEGRRPRDGGEVRAGAAEGEDASSPPTNSSCRCTRRRTATTCARSSTPTASWSSCKQKIQKYDAELKMSAAEAEIAKLAESFDLNLTTDFGQIESVIQQKIDQNRGKVRVAADLSSKGIAEIDAEEKMQAVLAEEALTNFEVELGLKSPETTRTSRRRPRTWDRLPPTRPSRNRRTESGPSKRTALRAE